MEKTGRLASCVYGCVCVCVYDCKLDYPLSKTDVLLRCLNDLHAREIGTTWCMNTYNVAAK